MALLVLAAMRRLTERTARSRTELALVVEAVPYGFLELDGELCISKLSLRAAAILGLERRGLPRTHFPQLFAAEDRAAVEDHLRGATRPNTGEAIITGEIRRETRAEIEATLPREKGAARRLVLVAATIGGSPDRIAVLIRDVTETRAAQAQLRESERLATIGSLASGVAHELNNPLSAIATFARTIDVSGLAAADVEAVRAIGDEALRAGGIVRNLLGFARKRQPERKPVAVGPIIERALVLRRYELRKDRVAVELDCPPDLPLVEGDDQQLLQVMLNLVVNAQQAMAERGGDERRLTIRVRGSLAAGLTIAVEDTGPGIPPDILPRLFEPFFTTKPEGVGTGLGLSLCEGIIAEQGGRVWAENRPEGGARFVVELPEVVALGQAVTRPSGTRAVAIAPQRILVADDDDGSRRALQRVLTKLGHQVEAVSDGLSALDRLRAETFDVVVSDLHMPGLSGMNLFYAVVAERPDVARRFLFVSGDTVSQEVRTFVERVGQPMLRKPYEIEALQHVLARVVTGDVRARASGTVLPPMP
jgi:two-component system NtrC family sensor kinase